MFYLFFILSLALAVSLATLLQSWLQTRRPIHSYNAILIMLYGDGVEVTRCEVRARSMSDAEELCCAAYYDTYSISEA